MSLAKIIGVCCLLGIWIGGVFKTIAADIGNAVEISSSLRTKCIEVLHEGMRQGTKWVKIHAGEDLLLLDYPQGVEETFEKEIRTHGSEPQYRIGLWRVMANAASSDSRRSEWINRIREAFLDEHGPDRGHAAETLGKIGYKPRAQGDEEFRRVAQGTNGEMAVLARWVLANSRGLVEQASLTEMLGHADAEVRGDAAYALRYQSNLFPQTLERLTATLASELPGSSARIYLVCAAFVHANGDRKAELKAELRKFAGSENPKEKCESCNGLAKAGGREDILLLEKLLHDPDLDVRVGAANAILQIGRRTWH